MNNAMNLLGAIVSLVFLISAILVFVARLAGHPEIGHTIGYFELALAIPLAVLLIKAPTLNRAALYYVQIGALLIWLLLEFCLDYLFKLNFRQTRWIVILYVTLFFAAAGGMVGLASLAGQIWGMAAIGLFIIMTVLVFVQRAKTGY